MHRNVGTCCLGTLPLIDARHFQHDRIAETLHLQLIADLGFQFAGGQRIEKDFIFGLRNVADTDLGLREMLRVCRPGGKIAVLEFSMPGWQPFRKITQRRSMTADLCREFSLPWAVVDRYRTKSRHDRENPGGES